MCLCLTWNTSTILTREQALFFIDKAFSLAPRFFLTLHPTLRRNNRRNYIFWSIIFVPYLISRGSSDEWALQNSCRCTICNIFHSCRIYLRALLGRIEQTPETIILLIPKIVFCVVTTEKAYTTTGFFVLWQLTISPIIKPSQLETNLISHRYTVFCKFSFYR